MVKLQVEQMGTRIQDTRNVGSGIRCPCAHQLACLLEVCSLWGEGMLAKQRYKMGLLQGTFHDILGRAMTHIQYRRAGSSCWPFDPHAEGLNHKLMVPLAAFDMAPSAACGDCTAQLDYSHPLQQRHAGVTAPACVVEKQLCQTWNIGPAASAEPFPAGVADVQGLQVGQIMLEDLRHL